MQWCVKISKKSRGIHARAWNKKKRTSRSRNKTHQWTQASWQYNERRKQKKKKITTLKINARDLIRRIKHSWQEFNLQRTIRAAAVTFFFRSTSINAYNLATDACARAQKKALSFYLAIFLHYPRVHLYSRTVAALRLSSALFCFYLRSDTLSCRARVLFIYIYPAKSLRPLDILFLSSYSLLQNKKTHCSLCVGKI